MKNLHFLLSFVLLISVISCHKDSIEIGKGNDDPSGADTLPVLNEDQLVMKDYHDELFPIYYWYDDVAEIVDMFDYKLFSTVSSYFESTLYGSDRWSWMADKDYYISMTTRVMPDTYGADLLQPIDYYNDYSIVVSMIYPESPLARHGVTRGWKLTHLGGTEVMDLVGQGTFEKEWNKPQQSFTFVDLNDSIHTFVESPAQYLNENPCLIAKVFGPDDYPGLTCKVGYLLYSSFAFNYNAYLDSIMQSFHDAGVEEMIVDLRYNGGGDLAALDVLASYLAPKSADGKVLQSTVHNRILSSMDMDSDVLLSVSEKSLDIDRLFVIISDQTASSSECLINGLRPYMEVNLVGRQSYGKPNGMYVLLYPCSDADYERYDMDDYTNLKYMFLPIAFYNMNSLQQFIPEEGFEPDNDRPDDLYHDFGVDEDNIRACLEKIVNGQYPELPSKRKHSTRSAVDGYVLPEMNGRNPLYGNSTRPVPEELRKMLQ